MLFRSAPVFHITSDVLPSAQRGTAYRAQLTSEAGVGVIRWKALTYPPAGIRVMKKGAIVGTPSRRLAPWTYRFTVQATDSTKGPRQVVTALVTLTVS